MSDPVLTARGCRWIPIPGVTDPRGSVNFLEFGKGLDFAARRAFWLHHIAPGQWRGRHGHREMKLVLIAVAGGCRAHLDDGTAKEAVTLNDPAKGLYIAPWVWHELTDFAPDSVILVLCSDLYDEAEYLRDYAEFKRLVAARPA
jgi:dTDP-4-dehydrorhamnose 3,5-epimerase-like enzyme